MSVQTEITRITNNRNTIRNKMIDLGLAESSAGLDALATAIDNMANQGAPDAEVKEGESYSILPGYYKGGTVRGVAGGGHYELQTKTVTPTKQPQSITPDSGYYGISEVTVNPIPQNYQDVSSVTAAASDVLANKAIVTSNGTLTAGTMPNNGAVSQSLNAGDSYTIPAGYHNGSGKVTANSLASQTGVDTGKIAITAATVLNGSQGWVNGAKVSGTMANNGAISGSIDGLSTTTYAIPAGYTSGGTVSLTDDIENALAAI